MTSPTKNPASFFIVPDEKRSYKSSVKLGNVIYQIKQPHQVLYRPDEATPALVVGDIAEPKMLENYHVGNYDDEETEVGLFAKILQFFSFGAELSHKSDTDASETYDIKSMTIELLDPSSRFLTGLKEEKSIMDILKNGTDPCAFLITGVATASGVVFKSTDVKNRANEASVGVNVQGAPLGLKGRRSKKRTLKVDWQDPGPTVLAFSVQKLKIEDGKLTATEYTDGGYFGDDDEPRKYEVNFHAELDQRDVAGLEPESGEDQLIGGKFKLYLPNE
ncbi:hypothetical protein QQS21_000503 [Conoideocrella luteorostrata]|uniref:Uncharacterized protein n=1 Tax=Conoideocrella luteorostrata TaxID=1105319 RepID=A0AAJ0G2M4_9HYPO|nr:hypothetical protein QQS21_000503 [Conoideocrella luteorostrata]